MAKLYKNPLISKDELFLNQSCIQSVPCEEEALNLLDEPLINHIQKEAYEQGYSAGQSAQDPHGEVQSLLDAGEDDLPGREHEVLLQYEQCRIGHL